MFETWVFPKIVVSPKWMVKIMENQTPIKMDDLGVPLFLETPTWYSNLLFKVVRCKVVVVSHEGNLHPGQ